MAGIVTLLHGPDRPGLVAKVSGWIYERGGNIIGADQHDDPQYGVFFQRVHWSPAADRDPSQEAEAFSAFAAGIGMLAQTTLESERPRVVVMVSQHTHACHELLLNWQAGDLPGDIVAMVSNHDTMQPTAELYGLP